MKTLCQPDPVTSAKDGIDYRIAVFFLILLCAVPPLMQVDLSFVLGNHLSIAEPYSEADVLRAAHNYYDNGFRINAGLADIDYGDDYPFEGDVMLHHGLSHFIYTHYPPGPEILAGLMMKVLGPGHVPWMRLLPITVSFAGALFFAFRLWSWFGYMRAAGFMLLLALTPAYGNMMLGLHQQGYQQGILFMELALLIGVFCENEVLDLKSTGLLFLIGFVQGWLTFDYFFITVLAPLVAFTLKDNLKKGYKSLAISIAALTAGFGFAHALHFLQVIIYYGSLHAAWADIGTTALYRAGGDQTSFPGLAERLDLIWTYLTAYAQTLGYYTVSLIPVYGAMIATGALLSRIKIPMRRRPAIDRLLLVLIVGNIVSLLWIGLMYTHAFYNANVVPRHLIVGFIAPLLYLFKNTVFTDTHNEIAGRPLTSRKTSSKKAVNVAVLTETI
jgi:hypothetical protein